MKSNAGYKVYMVPVPLGENSFPQFNSDAFKAVLSDTKYWVAENARTLRRFLSSTRLTGDIAELDIFELNREARESELNQFLKTSIVSGNIGVCSEAGLPGMADPGALVCVWAHKNQIPVVPLTGPGSIVLGLMASGLNGQQFVFHGYPPIQEAELKKSILHLGKEAQQTGYTQIWIETPYRSDRFLQFALQYLPAELLLCIACNLHSPEEWISTKSVSEWRKGPPELGKIPCVFLTGKAGKGLNW